jgi:hypothetical protein
MLCVWIVRRLKCAWMCMCMHSVTHEGGSHNASLWAISETSNICAMQNPSCTHLPCVQMEDIFNPIWPLSRAELRQTGRQAQSTCTATRRSTHTSYSSPFRWQIHKPQLDCTNSWQAHTRPSAWQTLKWMCQTHHCACLNYLDAPEFFSVREVLAEDHLLGDVVKRALWQVIQLGACVQA